MDVNTVQADAGSKAVAWLEQNLKPEAPAPDVVPVTPGVTLVATPAEAAPPAPAPVVTQVEGAKPGIADVIRRDREARASASAAAQEAAKYKGEVEALRKENEALKSLGAATDPFEFLRGRKLTKEQQALWGQAFLYDLKPEVAPQEFRLELYKAEQARKEAERAAEQERQSQEQAQQATRAQLDHYANELLAHVQTASGSCPESENWFSEDGPDGQPRLNQRVYAQSLMATADNIARRAQASGQQADLSPANVARTLEAEVARRMQRRDAKRASKAPVETKQVAPAVPAQGGAQTAVTTTTSAEGLRSGAPVRPAQTDEERRARAASVLFGTK